MQKYEVFVDDNFHFMDEEERSAAGTFDTLEEAVSVCRRIVDVSLQGSYEPGMSAHELFNLYRTFGDDPWIKGGAFSAWDYARERSMEICGPTKNLKKTKKRKKGSAKLPNFTATER